MGITSFIVLAGIVSGIFWWESDKTSSAIQRIEPFTAQKNSRLNLIAPATFPESNPITVNSASSLSKQQKHFINPPTATISQREAGEETEKKTIVTAPCASAEQWVTISPSNFPMNVNFGMFTFHGIRRVSETNEQEAHDSLKFSPIDESKSIKGITKIELTREELVRIGVCITPRNIRLLSESQYPIENGAAKELSMLGYDTNSTNIRLRFVHELGLDDKMQRQILHPPYKNLLSISPVIINQRTFTDPFSDKIFFSIINSPLLDSVAGLQQLQYEMFGIYGIDPNSFFKGSIQLRAKNNGSSYPQHSLPASLNSQELGLRKLIPVYIHIADPSISTNTGRNGTDIYLWYYPTPEFVSALPDRYRIPLQQELDAITDVVECQMPVGQVCERLTGEKTFFDFCRKSSGAIATVQAYPNPASQQITCHYQLTNQRLVTITLHDLSGKFLRELMAEQSVTAGTHETQLQLGDITPGAYLIAVKTDTGDQAVQRIIVQQ